jgi:hypothetical protein
MTTTNLPNGVLGKQQLPILTIKRLKKKHTMWAGGLRGTDAVTTMLYIND